MKLNLDTLKPPAEGDLIEIRLEISTSPGRTASWVVKVATATLNVTRQHRLTLTGWVTNARWGLLDDGRVERQRDNIDRLLTHLKQHCPELLGQGPCEHLGPEEKQERHDRGDS